MSAYLQEIQLTFGSARGMSGYAKKHGGNVQGGEMFYTAVFTLWLKVMIVANFWSCDVYTQLFSSRH